MPLLRTGLVGMSNGFVVKWYRCLGIDVQVVWGALG